MSQHDYDLANAAGATFRADANNALLAIVSDNYGLTEPATMFAYQWWADGTTGYLKQRNAANTAWIIKQKLSSDMLAALQKQEFTAFTSAGTSTAYTLTTVPAMAALTTNEMFRVNFHTASGAAPTLARDGLTAKLIKQYDSTGAKVTASLAANQLAMVEYDGTDYVVLNPLPSTYPASTKLPTLSATQATGAITVSATSQYLDFRSTTLTSGAISTVLAAPADLVIPSGATLGSTSGVAADIAMLIINNAGTAELAVVNLAGGIDLSESGVISTTAISAGSTSSTVIYSTTARTNVAYRVVKQFRGVNTAGSWASPSIISDIGVLSSPKRLAQMQVFQTGEVATGTTVIPADDTIPQNTEGDQYMSLAITPTNANSTLEVVCNFYGAISSSNNALVAALFRDTDANALTVSMIVLGNSAWSASLQLRVVVSANALTATTFKVRAGCNVAATTTFNGVGGARLFGGTTLSSIIIKEYLP